MEIKTTERVTAAPDITAAMDVRFEQRFKSEYPTGEKACLKLKSVLDNQLVNKDYSNLDDLCKVLNKMFEAEEILVFPHPSGPKLRNSVEKLYDNVFVLLHRVGRMPTAPTLETYVKEYKPKAQKKSLEILDDTVSDGRDNNNWEGIPKSFLSKMDKIMGLVGNSAIHLTDSALRSLRDYPRGLVPYVNDKHAEWVEKNPVVKKERNIPPHRFDIPRPERMVSGEAEEPLVEESGRTDWGLVKKALNAFKSALFKVAKEGADLASAVQHAADSMHMEVGQFKGTVLRGIRELEHFDGTYTDYVAHRMETLNQQAAAEEEVSYTEGDRVVLKPKNGEKPRVGRVTTVPATREDGTKNEYYTVLVDSEFRLGNDDDGEHSVKVDDIQGLETPKDEDSADTPKQTPVNEKPASEAQDEEDEAEAVEESAETLEADVEQIESAILGTEYYTMFKLKSAKLVLRRRNRDYEFRRGDPLGWRFSSNGKFFRLISPFYGAKIVFSIPITEENLSWLMRQDPKAKSKKNAKNPK